jgi:hypothetical protein
MLGYEPRTFLRPWVRRIGSEDRICRSQSIASGGRRSWEAQLRNEVAELNAVLAFIGGWAEIQEKAREMVAAVRVRACARSGVVGRLL